MYPELTQFKSWLKCQYPNSSASVHYSSDLALFFSYLKKTPASITPSDVDRYISYSLLLGNRPSTIIRRLSAVRKSYPFARDVSDPDNNSSFLWDFSNDLF